MLKTLTFWFFPQKALTLIKCEFWRLRPAPNASHKSLKSIPTFYSQPHIHSTPFHSPTSIHLNFEAQKMQLTTLILLLAPILHCVHLAVLHPLIRRAPKETTTDAPELDNVSPKENGHDNENNGDSDGTTLRWYDEDAKAVLRELKAIIAEQHKAEKELAEKAANGSWLDKIRAGLAQPVSMGQSKHNCFFTPMNCAVAPRRNAVGVIRVPIDAHTHQRLMARHAHRRRASPRNNKFKL